MFEWLVGKCRRWRNRAADGYGGGMNGSGGMRDKAKNDTPEEVHGPDGIGIFDRQLKVEGRIFREESPRARSESP